MKPGRGPAGRRVAVRTSDVARPRTLLVAAAGAVAGVTIALFAESAPVTTTPRAIARTHVKVLCTSCHGETGRAPATADACKKCHGGSHDSVRTGHEKMIAKGEMTCLTCHRQHDRAQGVTFEDGKIVRWGAGGEATFPPPRQTGIAPGAIASGTTVPLVPLTLCVPCHDPARPSDPIAACVPRGGSEPRVAQCFDEHVRVRQPHPSSGKAVCKKQHDDARFVAWDAAREVAATTPWVAPARPEGTPWAPIGGALAGAAVLGGLSAALERRRRREGEAPAGKTPVVPASVKKLPVVNASTCLGCYACVDACPFDVLAIERYVAVVARPEECCGVVLCEQVCPNGSLTVTDGAPILDRPATDDELESKDVPGVFLAGDLTGLPLIKNAINQGVRVVDRIAATLPKRARGGLDLVIVGAGPAGISAALRAKEKGLSAVVLEQATVAASIKSFPREKIVHDPPLHLPVEGELWLERSTKEELLAQWTRIVRAREVDVREGHKVLEITKAGDQFHVKTGPSSETFTAPRVVLAIGRRGTPRKLDAVVDPGAEAVVAYSFADARSFEGKKVLIVGLGDSAMEAALALARQPNTSVTVSYRGKGFARGKAKNIRQVEALVAEKKIKVLFETTPVSIAPTSAVLEGTGPHRGRRTVAHDAVLVLIGGEPSWDLLERIGIVRPRA